MSRFKKKLELLDQGGKDRSSLAYLDQSRGKSRPDVQRQSLDLSLYSDLLAQTTVCPTVEDGPK